MSHKINTKHKTLRTILRFIPMFVVMGIIYFFSCFEGDDSSATSERILNVFVKLFNEVSRHGLSANAIMWIHIIIRKIAHLCEYAALGFFAMFALYNLIRNGVGKWAFVIAELIAVLYAVTDEFHQYHVPGRWGTWSDVVIDGCGALIGIFVYYGFWRLKHIPRGERLSRKYAKRLKKKAKRNNKKENLVL